MYYWSVTEGEVHIEGRTELDSHTLYKKTCCSVISVVALVTASKSMAETTVPLIKFSHLSYGRSYAQRLTLTWWNNGTLVQSYTTHSPTQWSWFRSWWRPLWSKCSTINPLLSLLPRTAWSISETTFFAVVAWASTTSQWSHHCRGKYTACPAQAALPTVSQQGLPVWTSWSNYYYHN